MIESQSPRIPFAMFGLLVVAAVGIMMFVPQPIDAAGLDPDSLFPQASIWTIERTPSPDQFSNLLAAISADSPQDIWAVGQISIHFDGNRWKAIPMVKKGDVGSFEMDGVVALSDSDVWAVGQFGQGGLHHALVEHWDGASWKVVASPHFADGEILMGVTALSPQDVWAVGWFVQVSSNSILPLVQHWDGVSWKNVATPATPGDFFLNKVAAISDSDIWAVGFTGNLSGSDRTFAMHYDGHSWKTVSTPSVGQGENKLSGVTAIATNDVWAAGESAGAVDGASRTLIEHWDGVQWSVVSSPNVNPSQGNRLFGIGAISGTDIWACGSFFMSNGSGRQETLVEHWDGSAWTISASPSRGYSDTLFGVAALEPGNVWLAGTAIVPPALDTLILKTTQGF